MNGEHPDNRQGKWAKQVDPVREKMAIRAWDLSSAQEKQRKAEQYLDNPCIDAPIPQRFKRRLRRDSFSGKAVLTLLRIGFVYITVKFR